MDALLRFLSLTLVKRPKCEGTQGVDAVQHGISLCRCWGRERERDLGRVHQCTQALKPRLKTRSPVRRGRRERERGPGLGTLTPLPWEEVIARERDSLNTHSARGSLSALGGPVAGNLRQQPYRDERNGSRQLPAFKPRRIWLVP